MVNTYDPGYGPDDGADVELVSPHDSRWSLLGLPSAVGGRLKLGILSIEASWLQCTFEIRYILFVLKPTFFFFPAGTGKIGGVHAEFESALSSKTANAMSSKAMSLKGAGVT